jgi:hypothetical protein
MMKNKKYGKAIGKTNVKYNPEPSPLRGMTWPGQKQIQSGSKKK